MTALALATGGNYLIAQLDAARDQLDRGVFMLNRAIDLRERLDMGLDLDDMRAEVDCFGYAVRAHKWWRSQ